jgi:hypothetical protein
MSRASHPAVLFWPPWADGAMTVKLQVRWLGRPLSVHVRGVRRFASLSARTYSGQGTLFTRPIWEFGQVSGHSDGWGEAVCKTVGLAYAGSNPAPATTCGNGP